jgi:hypothetical protein
MKKLPVSARYFIAVAFVLSISSWGFLVHKTCHQLAVYELPQKMQRFFYANIDSIVKYAVRPDDRRSTDKTEAPKHFIDIEAYGDSAEWKMPLNWNDAVAKYTKDTLIKYGYVPYHVIAEKNKLTEAFKNGNADSILFYAIDLGHYVEDANVPLHTSINYDGQFTHQKGLHALWESVTPEVEITNYDLYTKHKAKYLKNPSLSIWKAVRHAHDLLPNVFGIETKLSATFPDSVKYKDVFKYGKHLKYYTDTFATAYGAALKPTINDQLKSSANLVADFWYTAWVDAGKPDLDKLLSQPFSAEQKAAMKKESKSFKGNTLIKDKLLRSMRGSFRD